MAARVPTPRGSVAGLWPNPRDTGFVLLHKQIRWGFAQG